MKKRILALGLAALMCLTAGCGSASSGANSGNDGATSAAEAAAEETSAAEAASGETSVAEAASGETSAAEAASGETSAADAASEETSTGEEASETADDGADTGAPVELAYDENGMPLMPVLTDTRSEEYKENTFTTLNGDEVTYNMNTRRIVCVFGSQDVVGFGIKLLAYEGSTEIEGYEDYYEGAEALLNTSPFSPEEVLSYEPELILVNQQMSQSQIEQLSKIAPTIPLYTDSTDFATRLGYIGEIFGLEESANVLISYADALKNTMVQQLKDLNLSDKTLTIYTYMGAISIPPDRGWFMNTIIYDYAGIGRLPNVEEFMTDESGMAYEAISAEKLRDYEGDMVIYAGFGEDTISSYVTENVGWQSLNAVREDRVGIIDITPYAQKGVILLADQYRQVLEALKVAGQVGE